MIWNPPTKPWRHFFLDELETSWDVSTFLGRASDTKELETGFSEASENNISKLNLSTIFFSRHEFWDIRLQDVFATFRNQLCFVCSKKKEDTTNVFQLLTSRNTTEKNKNNPSLRWVRFPSSWRRNGNFKVLSIPSGKLTWQWKSTFSNRPSMYKWGVMVGNFKNWVLPPCHTASNPSIRGVWNEFYTIIGKLSSKHSVSKS